MSEKVGKIRFYPMTALRLEFTRFAAPRPDHVRIVFRIGGKRETSGARREPYRGTTRTLHFKIRPDGTDCPCNAN
ncbi:MULTISPECIES: hypothetical protein [unclassified Caballeronia]|uniref:hypothetical protein n=1 Tax=unclassified Caballeronia TaxID=2646786 RepID=UPI002866282A|nr:MULTISPECIES: hypothetical protein [unclassified Caballeronia]MDR5749633.1 hypothetical protein [Caballeronia sp. LZ024]MDR5843237.1 hypothetical protein [Caballeronia sp. LZ031]